MKFAEKMKGKKMVKYSKLKVTNITHVVRRDWQGPHPSYMPKNYMRQLSIPGELLR